MKKKLFVLAVAVIILAGMATGTLAYFTAKEVAHNVITTGEIDIDLKETQDLDNDPSTPETPYPTGTVGGIMPGVEHSKIVRVHNIGGNDAWVRVKVTKKIMVDGEELPADVLSIDFDNTKWTEKDGYYYYKDILKPAGTTGADVTVPLFTQVSFAGEAMDNRYQNASITINVQAFATQSDNNGTTVMEAKGWPAENVLARLLG